ncbi:MAG TPA: ABC transporter permease [Bryobacteraceae bacterium]|nr:ABC transporter permease [Bryobacteraceae bacterium]
MKGSIQAVPFGPLDLLRRATRSLRRAPALSLISVLTVALGVGAGTSLFSVVKAVLLNPLPYPDPGRLAWIAEVNEAGRPMQVAQANFKDWQRENRSFSLLAAFSEGPVNAGGGDNPVRTFGAEVTGDFFSVMGVQPAIGRTFDPAEQSFRAAGTVILGNALWHRAYGGDPAVLGRSVKLMGQPFTVIGVMPPGFDYPDHSEVWVAAGAFFDFPSRTAHNFRAVGRLRPGVTMERAQADVGAISRRLKQQYPSPFMAKDAVVVPLDREIAGEARPALLLLFGAVGFLLLIVCVNVANLLMVRITTRVREISVRVALGAGRAHLFRQMLAESLVLAAAGGALGLLVAYWSMDLLRILLPGDLPRADDIRIDRGVVAFALAISALTGFLFGVLPAWRASRLNLNDALKAASRSATAGRHAHRAQAALVISEVCLSLVLVAGAGLLANSFWKLRSVNPGFTADHVLAANASFTTPSRDSGFDRLSPMFRELLAQLRLIPGVESAALVKDLPLDGFMRDGHFNLENRPQDSGKADAVYRIVSPGYLTTMRIPLLRGRDLNDGDTQDSLPVVLISTEMARIYWPDEDPIGRRIWFDSFSPKEQWLTVVGIAGDVHESSLTRPAEPTAYVTHTQVPLPSQLLDENFVLRTTEDPSTIVAAVRDRIHSADREAAVKFETMDRVLSRSVARERFQMQVLGGFALLALLLAAIGLYGVLAYMVNSNRPAIAIRMALGAQPRAIFGMVTLRALRLAAFGTALGLAGCLAVRKLLSSLLFGIGPSDPATLGGATAVLLAVALAASWFPARKAMRVDPISALHEE